MTTERLIDAICERPLLWDPKHPMYRNRGEMKRLWTEIAKELQLECSVLKSKWKGLRDYYRVECKKMKGNETEDCRGSAWPYFVQMSFLKDSLPTRIRAVDVESQSARDAVADGFASTESDADLHELLEVTLQDSPENESFLSVRTDRSENSVSKRCTRDACEYDVIESDKLKTIVSDEHPKEEEEEDLLFFRSLLRDVRKLPRRSKLQLRVKIQQLVLDELSNVETTDGLS